MNLQEEHKKSHKDAVEDVMRVKKQLAGFGIPAHQDIVTDWYKVFELYYDMDIESLHKEHESLCAQATRHVHELHPVGESSPTVYRELREDEQDTED